MKKQTRQELLHASLFTRAFPHEEWGKGVFGAVRVFPVELLVQQHCSVFIFDAVKVTQAAVVHKKILAKKKKFGLPFKIAYCPQPFMSVLD